MKKLRVTVNGIQYDVEVEVLEDTDNNHHQSPYGLPTSYQSSNVHVAAPAPQVQHAEPPKASNTSEDKKVLTSPLSGIIVEIKVAPGALVKEHEPLVILEAMKMNTNISSPVSGKVKEVKVKAKDTVQQG